MRRSFVAAVLVCLGTLVCGGGVAFGSVRPRLGAAALRGGPLWPQPRLFHRIPAPPREVGCYRYTAALGWRRRHCLSSAYVLAHFPHPKIGGTAPIVGIQQGKILPGPVPTWFPAGSPLQLSMLRVDDLAFGSETDSIRGPDAYSLQINTNLYTGQGQPATEQFVDQSKSVAFGTSNLVCIWQIDLASTTPYAPTGCSDFIGGSFAEIEGWVDGATLGVAVANPLGTSAIAGIQPDIYGLGSGDNWNYTQGSMLGYGGGSQAVFTNTEMNFNLTASSCNDYGGFLIGLSTFCGPTRLRPDAYLNDFTGSVAVPPTAYTFSATAESNNLKSVFGTPPGPLGKPAGVYPPLNWFGPSAKDDSADLFYSATTTGACWTGPPCTNL